MNKALWIGLGVVVLIIIGGAVSFAMRGRDAGTATQSSQPVTQGTTSTAATTPGSGGGGGNGTGQGRQSSSGTTSTLMWQQGQGGWQAIGTPPACPSPFTLNTPTDLTNVTSILYPGQLRGGNYKPHGGFRFDGAGTNAVVVTAPLDATLVRGSRYLVGGETQYTFDFIVPCGYMYRLGHLLTLDQTFQAIADQFPAAVEGDSRTTNVNPPIAVTAGQKIASAVGVTKGTDVFFDFGVYDLRTKNDASKDATWAANPMHDPELAQHAVCWFDLLSATDAARVRSLPPGDPTSGKNSDFCK